MADSYVIPGMPEDCRPVIVAATLRSLSAALEAGKVERGTLIQALKDGGEIQRIAIARAEAAEAERDALRAELAEAVTLLQDMRDHGANDYVIDRVLAFLARHQKETHVDNKNAS